MEYSIYALVYSKGLGRPAAVAASLLPTFSLFAVTIYVHVVEDQGDIPFMDYCALGLESVCTLMATGSIVCAACTKAETKSERDLAEAGCLGMTQIVFVTPPTFAMVIEFCPASLFHISWVIYYSLLAYFFCFTGFYFEREASRRFDSALSRGLQQPQWPEKRDDVSNETPRRTVRVTKLNEERPEGRQQPGSYCPPV